MPKVTRLVSGRAGFELPDVGTVFPCLGHRTRHMKGTQGTFMGRRKGDQKRREKGEGGAPGVFER